MLINQELALERLESYPVMAPRYYYPLSQHSVTASGALSNGTLRIAPWAVTREISFDRIGAEISVVGEAGSKLRLGIYEDNGSCFPGKLVLDAGQINGDSATVQELVCSQTLPVGLFWIGAVVQSAPATTPTVRCVNAWSPPVPIAMSVVPPTAGATAVGFATSGVPGALPDTFPVGTAFATGSAPRLFVRNQ